MAQRRQTGQRDAVQQAFALAQRPLTAVEAHRLARRRAAGLGLATVYRTLALLVEEGVLRPVPLPDGTARYELAGLDHHHHFQCRDCGKVFDVPGCPGKLRDLTPRGFELEEHELILYGRCAACVGG